MFGYRLVPIALVLCFVLLATPDLQAQENGDIDPSKPTNLYTKLGNFLENIDKPDDDGSQWGYRFQPNLAMGDHLIMGEFPLLYDEDTQKFGLGDIRARYFWLPYKDYSSTFAAFGPSLDVFFPTGSFEDGLGSSSWQISPGITTAFAFGKFMFFPIISYRYKTKPATDLIPENLKETQSGANIQIFTPINFSTTVFMVITPMYFWTDFSDSSLNTFVAEVQLNKLWNNKHLGSIFYRWGELARTHNLRLGYTYFL